MVSVQRHVAVLRGMLQPGEAERLWVRAERLGRGQHGALLLTDRRLLFCGLAFVSQAQEAWPLGLLGDRRVRDGVLSVSVVGEAERFRGRPADLDRLAAALPDAADPGGDLPARLERLAALHADGALTADEFQAAKRRLLGSA